MNLLIASLWVDPRDTPGEPTGTHKNPGEMVKFWYFFFPRGRGELFSFSLDRGNIPTGFVRLLVSGISLSTKVFFAPFYFISIYDPVRQAR